MLKTKTVTKSKNFTIVGRREKISLPDYKLENIEAKVDTGAYSTSIHCKDIYVERNKENNEQILFFTLPKRKYKLKDDLVLQSKIFTRKKVISSSGHAELRYIIKTHLKLGEKELFTDISLADRSNLKFPILIGRKVLSKGFLVDVRKINLTLK